MHALETLFKRISLQLILLWRVCITEKRNIFSAWQTLQNMKLFPSQHALKCSKMQLRDIGYQYFPRGHVCHGPPRTMVPTPWFIHSYAPGRCFSVTLLSSFLFSLRPKRKNWTAKVTRWRRRTWLSAKSWARFDLELRLCLRWVPHEPTRIRCIFCCVTNLHV